MSSTSPDSDWPDLIGTLLQNYRGFGEQALASIRELFETARRALPCAEAGLLTPMAENDKLRFLVSVNSRPGVWEILKEIKIPCEGSIAGYVFSTGNPVAVANPTDYNQTVDKVTGLKTEYYMAVPIISEDDVLGVATFLNRPVDCSAKEFRQEEIVWCRQLGYLLTVALRSYHRTEQVVRLFRAELAETVRSDLPEVGRCLDAALLDEAPVPLLARALQIWEQLPEDEQELATGILEALREHVRDREEGETS